MNLAFRLLAATATSALSCTSISAADTPSVATTQPAKPAFSTSETDVGSLLDNPKTRAVLDKHIPQFVSNPQIDMARSMTMKQIQSFAGDVLTDEVLSKIDADLAAVPKD